MIENSLADSKEKKAKSAKPSKNKVESTKIGGQVFIPILKKKKKIRYPKNFNPLLPGPLPNPERWIPKWQR